MRKKSPIPPNGEILLYQAPDGTAKLNVRLVNESVWLSIDQMALLFGVDKSGISRHLKNIFATGELVKPATVAKLQQFKRKGTVRSVVISTITTLMPLFQSATG